MRLSVERDAALKAVASAQAVVNRSNTIPILQDLLLTARAGRLEFVGTDLDVEVAAGVAADIEAEGEAAVPAVRLHDILRNLPSGGEVFLALEGARLVVKCARSRFQLPALPTGDYPRLGRGKQSHTAELPAADLLRLLNTVAIAMGNEEGRAYLKSVVLQVVQADEGPRLRAVATDGSRLALCEADCPDGWREAPMILIPRKSVGEVQRQLGVGGDVRVWTDGAVLGLETKASALVTKLLGDTFPDYTRVIPADPPTSVEVEATVLAGALKRVTLMTSDKVKAVKLDVTPGRITLSARDGEGGDAVEEIEASCATELTQRFNGRLLADLVDQVGKDLRFGFGSAADPVLIEDVHDPAVRFVIIGLRV